MFNALKHGKYSIEDLPEVNQKRLVIQTAGKKGKGVFLNKGISLSKGDYVMAYSGRLWTKDPLNDYTFAKKGKKKGETIYVDAL
jgi:hypothetical protein